MILFYTSIFVAILVATLIARFLYKVITNKNRAANAPYRRIIITDYSRNYQRKTLVSSICKYLPTAPVQEDGMVYSNLGGVPRDKSAACHNLDTSWLIRESRLLAMYEAYMATRSAEQEPLTLEMVSKPFRRTITS